MLLKSAMALASGLTMHDHTTGSSRGQVQFAAGDHGGVVARVAGGGSDEDSPLRSLGLGSSGSDATANQSAAIDPSNAKQRQGEVVAAAAVALLKVS